MIVSGLNSKHFMYSDSSVVGAFLSWVWEHVSSNFLSHLILTPSEICNKRASKGFYIEEYQNSYTAPSLQEELQASRQEAPSFLLGYSHETTILSGPSNPVLFLNPGSESQRPRAPPEVEWCQYLLFLVFRLLPFLVPFLVFPRTHLFLLVLLVLFLLLFLFRRTFF